jgi:hypothetical protein
MTGSGAWAIWYAGYLAIKTQNVTPYTEPHTHEMSGII